MTVQNISKLLMVSVAGFALSAMLPHSAQAGFDWTPPAKTAAPSSALPSGTAPTAQPAPDVLTPEPDAPAPVTPVDQATLPVDEMLPAPGEMAAPGEIPAAASTPASTEPALKTLPAKAAPAPVTAAAPETPMPAPPEQAQAPAPSSTSAVASAPKALTEDTARPTPQKAAEPAVQPETDAASGKFRHLSRAESHSMYKGKEGNAPLKDQPSPKTVSGRDEAAQNASPASAVETEAPVSISGLDQTPVQGFGKDISLAIALSQIVPPKYAFQFADGVNAGQKVSWQGGKPWIHVLSDVLVPNQLQAVIQGNVVIVKSASAPAFEPQQAAAPVAPQAPAPAPVFKSDAATEAKPDDAAETKVARLAPPATETGSKQDLPLPSEKAKAMTAPAAAHANEAQASEANEKKALETSMGSNTKADEKPVIVAAKDGKMPVVDMTHRRQWEAAPGRTLRETLEDWSGKAGAELEWMSPYDYPVDHAFAYEGTFNDAVESILALYSREDQRPRGRLYPNLPSGPSVLMIN